MLSKDQVKHIAELARISISDEESEKYVTQLSGILDYMSVLNEVNTDDVPGTNQVSGLENITRPDVEERFCSKDELLKCTELKVVAGQVKVLKVIK